MDLGEYTATWPERNPKWRVRVRLALVEGRPDCVAVHVEALDDENPEPVRATVLRQLPIGRFVAEGRKALSEKWRREAGRRMTAPVPKELGLIGELMHKMGGAAHAINAAAALEDEPAEERRKGGRPSKGRAHYAKVAEVYSAALAAGENPTQAVAQRFHLSPSAAAKQVARARNRHGLLPPTTRGRPTGHQLEEDDV